MSRVKWFIDKLFPAIAEKDILAPDLRTIISYVLIGLVTPCFYMLPLLISKNFVVETINAGLGLIIIGFIGYIAISAYRNKELSLFYKTAHIWLLLYGIVFLVLLFLAAQLSNQFFYIALIVVFLPMIPLLLSADVLVRYLISVYHKKSAADMLVDKNDAVDESFLEGADTATVSQHKKDRMFRLTKEKSQSVPYTAKIIKRESITMPVRKHGPVTSPVGTIDWAIEVSDNIDKI